MSRLTPKEREKGWANKVPVGLAIEKLAQYEDLEEQGRLIELPCKVGDSIWVANRLKGGVAPYHITSIIITKHGKILQLLYDGDDKSLKYQVTKLPAGKLGKWIFFTKAEAEAKLSELKGGEKDA